MTERHPRLRALPSPTYLRPPQRGLRAGRRSASARRREPWKFVL